MNNKSQSFSDKVKIKLSSIFPNEQHCALCELAGMTLFSNEFSHEQILLSSNVAEVLDKYIGLFLKFFDTELVLKTETKNKVDKYYIEIKNEQAKALYNLVSNDGKINFDLFKCDKCKESFLRGVFLSSGHVNPPIKEYDIEFKTTNIDLACELYSILVDIISSPKMSFRSNKQIVYTKSGDNVSTLLLMIGASNYAYDILNSQVIKSIRNEQNRKVNFYVANMKKQSGSTNIQIEAIKYLKKTKKIKDLSPTLIATANLRYKHREASIQELADLEEHKVSKSQESKRLAAIVDYYNQLIKEKGD